MMNADGSTACDRCGNVEANSGIDKFLLVNDISKDAPGMIQVYYFCRTNKCDVKLLRPTMLGAYTSEKEARESEKAGA